MATYKVLQDIEAEDKLLGPLTLKQFIFAIVAIFSAFCQFWLITKVPIVLAIPFVVVLLPVTLVMGFLAAPISREQSNDIWLLARLRFLFRPRKRIWNQDGVSDLVTITVPKQIAHVFTNNLSQTEVRSRLTALANTVDSRGWAIKNVNTNMFAEPSYLANNADSDRLIDPMSLPQDVPVEVVSASDDILDIQNNPTAQNLDRLVQESTRTQHDQAVATMHHDPATTPTQQNYWFMNQPDPQAASSAPADYATFQNQQVVAPGGTDAVQAAQETAEETALADRFVEEHKKAAAQITDHMKTLQPLHNPDGTIRKQPAPDPVAMVDDQQGQTNPNPAIVGLALNDDLNVATIARQAKKISKDDDEVVISLH